MSSVLHRSDTSIVEEVTPHRKRPRDAAIVASDEIVNVTRYHLRIPELVRHVAASTPPTGMDVEQFNRVAEACRILSGVGSSMSDQDPFLSLFIPPTTDVYSWPVTVGSATDGRGAIRARAELLSLEGKTWESEELLRALSVLEVELGWAGMHTLEDISEELVSGRGTSCLPYTQTSGQSQVKNTRTGVMATTIEELVGREPNQVPAVIMRVTEHITSRSLEQADNGEGGVQVAMSLRNASLPTPMDVDSTGRGMLRVLPETMRKEVSAVAGLPAGCQPSDVVISGGELQRTLQATRFATSTMLAEQGLAGGRRWYLKVGTAISAVSIPSFLVLPASAVEVVMQLCGLLPTTSEAKMQSDAQINGFMSLEELTGKKEAVLQTEAITAKTLRDDIAMQIPVADGSGVEIALSEWVWRGRVVDCGGSSAPATTDVLTALKKARKISMGLLRSGVQVGDVTLKPTTITVSGYPPLNGWIATLSKPNVFVVLHGPRVGDGMGVDPSTLKQLNDDRDALALTAFRERQAKNATNTAVVKQDTKNATLAQVSVLLRNILSHRGQGGATVQSISSDLQNKLGDKREW
jgi:hypothetical protein